MTGRQNKSAVMKKDACSAWCQASEWSEVVERGHVPYPERERERDPGHNGVPHQLGELSDRRKGEAGRDCAP